ncbi:hypothetical protein [Paludisphaera sp.]|uniref:hypothetical protein n=1 Tax=Paludisphaera sp. TaxID=2017432 RepID=UPI00301D2C5C
MESANAALERIVQDLTTMLVGNDPKHVAKCKRVRKELAKIEDSARKARLLALEQIYNATFGGRKPKDRDDYDLKKQWAKEVNEDLRKDQCAIRHPESGQPCSVFAIASPDGKGRYVLGNRITKKRTHSSPTISELFPVKLVPEPKRREGFLNKKIEDD